MVIGLLAITNPNRKNNRMFDYVEGRLTHNYIIYSIYTQNGFRLSDDGKYKVYRRYVGVASTFFEIAPEKDPVDSL